MNRILFPIVFLAVSCAKPSAYPPVGDFLSEENLNVSRNRAKNLNQMERQQIEAWIANQATPYYSMSLNYWISLDGLQNRSPKKDGERVSYEYKIYDFDGEEMDFEIKLQDNAILGKFDDLKAVEDAVRYLLPNEEVTLLVPSVLAYGTYGDGKAITNDMPLIIKLKMK